MADPYPAWMLGFVHVFDHPYFAVTKDKGAFPIPNVPAGTYTLKAWHEDAGSEEARSDRPRERRRSRQLRIYKETSDRLYFNQRDT